MMIKKMYIMPALLWVSSCGTLHPDIGAEEMHVRASELTKLSTAVESLVRYKNPPASWQDQDLLTAATAHDPAILDDLGKYHLRILNQERHAIVLMCTADGKQALLEDAGCTGRLDTHHWSEQNRPCEFTLSVKAVCGGA